MEKLLSSVLFRPCPVLLWDHRKYCFKSENTEYCENCGVYLPKESYRCVLHFLQNSLEERNFHRITECSRLEGTSVGRLVQPSCRSRVTYSRLHRTLSRRVLNISREGDSTTSLGSLFQCSVTLSHFSSGQWESWLGFRELRTDKNNSLGPSESELMHLDKFYRLIWGVWEFVRYWGPLTLIKAKKLV